MGIEYARKYRKTKPKKGTKARAAWERRERQRREREVMYGHKNSADEVAQENLHLIDKPRKPMPTAFKARRPDTCAKCASPIEVGQTVHYRPSDGQLVHHQHRLTAKVEAPCPRCWLIHPGDCE